MTRWRFRKWLFSGINSRPGISGLGTWWLLFHFIAALILAVWVDLPIHESARTILFPFTGLVMSMLFTRINSVHIILQEPEIKKLSQYVPDGIAAYLYNFQLGILIVFLSFVLWAMAGLKCFSHHYFAKFPFSIIIETILFFVLSLSLKECWDMVTASQSLVLARSNIENTLAYASKENDGNTSKSNQENCGTERNITGDDP